MWRAATAWSAGLLSVCVVGCWSRPRLPPPEMPAATPLPQGEQSLPDLDRVLRGGGPALVASLERADRLSDKSAGVKVTVAGIGLVDPLMVGEEARFGQGHLHYQID